MIIWVIGMSSAGKTEIAKRLYNKLQSTQQNTVFLDGDLFREAICKDLGFTVEEREESEARTSGLCKLLDDQGINVVCAKLSNSPKWRKWNRENIKNYYEVYLKVPKEILFKRDKKGLYKKALNKEIKNVVGIDIEFIPPESPDLVIENTGDEESIPEVVDKIISSLPVKT